MIMIISNMEQKGVHATIKEYEEKIKKEGFSITSGGRLGSGSYFWIGIKKEILGICWYKFCLKIGKYKNASDKRGILIFALIKTDDDFYLDLEDIDLKKIIHTLIEEKKIENYKQLSALYDEFLSQYEIINQKRIKVLRGKVPPPKDCKEYDMRIYGTPDCLVVRDPSIIKIIDIKDI